MWFTFSLLTIAAWGGSDLFSKRGTRPDDRYSHLKLVIAVGIVMFLHAVAFIAVTRTEFHPSSILRYLPVSALYIGSMVIGYAGLRYIELSVSSPICNSSGAVTAVLCFLLLGQRMEALQLLGVGLICVGIFLLSLLEKRASDLDRLLAGEAPAHKYSASAIAIIFPILYCIIDGAGSYLDAYYLENLMSEAEANLSYEFTFAICALLSFLYLRFVRRESFSLLREPDFALAAVCETAGQFTYVYALADNAIVAAPMIASYSIFSVILSRIFLREQLSRTQYAVIAMVMLGIAILGIFDV